jgi:hypothetical protein
MLAFKWSFFSGYQNTFLTFRCSQFISVRQFLKRRNYCYHVTYGDTKQSTCKAKCWIPAQKTDQHCFPVAVYLPDKFRPPNSPFGCGEQREKEKWLKSTMVTHSHATVHLFICAYSLKQMEFKELSQD